MIPRWKTRRGKGGRCFSSHQKKKALCEEHKGHSRGRKTEHTIVTPHKRITIAAPQLAIDELACTLECNVHVAVHRLEFACSTKRNAMLANLRWSFPLTFA
jgi:hypothetical protein